MRKRVVAVVAAAVLAALGVVVLVMWAQDADERAYAGAKREAVLQVTEPVAAGKRVSELESAFEEKKLPVDAIPEGAVTDFTDVAGLTTLTSLEPGEVLLRSRLGTPGQKAGALTDVPPGMQEIAVALDTQHAVGGAIRPGDRVGVIATFNKPEEATNFTLQNVLVTKTEKAVSNEEDLTGLMVTLAVETEGAERVAHAAEWGKVWLTRENDETERDGRNVMKTKDVLR